MSASRTWLRRGVATATLALAAGGAFAAFGAGSEWRRERHGEQSAGQQVRRARLRRLAEHAQSSTRWHTYNKTAEGSQGQGRPEHDSGRQLPDQAADDHEREQRTRRLLQLGRRLDRAVPEGRTADAAEQLLQGEPEAQVELPAVDPQRRRRSAATTTASRCAARSRSCSSTTSPCSASDRLSLRRRGASCSATSKTLKSRACRRRSRSAAQSQWPTLMWFEYLYDRVAGPSLITNALAGQKSVWKHGREQQGARRHRAADQRRSVRPVEELGLGQLQQRAVERRADGQRHVRIRADGLVGLLDDPGRWFDCDRHAPPNGPGAAFVAAGKLGYTAFPSVPGGKGNLDDLAGNTENYYSVLAKTRYPQAVADFLKVMYTPGASSRRSSRSAT